MCVYLPYTEAQCAAYVFVKLRVPDDGYNTQPKHVEA
jgi:hypothetical protein